MACCGLVYAGASVAAAQQPIAANGSALVNPETSVTVAGLPDSPGVTFSKTQAAVAQQSSSARLQGAPTSDEALDVQAQASEPPSQDQGAQSSPERAQHAAQKPVGTAAAEPIRASGVAGSQPAGVAIAPAKQRRVRTIVLRVGVIVGAGVAVGSVIALTEATSSKPPGAH
jgi:hypothetical protein